VTARAVDLPDVIEVDVSTITELNGSIHVSDLPHSDKYEITEAPEEVLAMVQPPRREVEEVEAVPEEAEAAAEATEAAEAAPSAEQQESS
jgi:hypothetical protein